MFDLQGAIDKLKQDMQEVVKKKDILREATEKVDRREMGAASMSTERFSWDGVRVDPKKLNVTSNFGSARCIQLPSSAESDEHFFS